MARSKKPTIGDVYEVPLQGGEKGYVQYIGNDSTQLNSDVIRAFKKRYPLEVNPDLAEILADEIQFYCHVTGMEFGEKDGSWKRVGNSESFGDQKAAFFRDAADDAEKRSDGTYGLPRISRSWNLWRMNEPMKRVAKLEGENVKASIGVVTWPKSIVHQMQTGEWSGFYPAYK